MGTAFQKMNKSLNKNLEQVNLHIQNVLQNQDKNLDEPEIESLSMILNSLTLNFHKIGRL